MPESIPQPDRHHVLAAQGWLELGNSKEAGVELEKISPGLNQHPAVLEIRWQIQARAKHWAECVELATAIIRVDPTTPMGWIHRSYALHELRQTVEARDGLLSVAGIFPEEKIICYNLACYECTLGNSAKALEWLGKLFTSKDTAEWKATALQDEDLKPLWPIIPKF